MSASDDVLLLSGPEESVSFYGARSLRWRLEGRDGEGFVISWLAFALGARRPEAIALASKDGLVRVWDDVAVSHKENPEDALADILDKLSALGYTVKH
jgi:hypothetical protein